ncbi:MAG: glycoside hydrolase family 27 protein [Anaerolineae bacterium]|nr:glycoside hydrolase family 27 protein [Anaerolineae bacterium]
MGWNSWDCYGPTVREEEVKANADYMAAHLANFGWNYVVVDIQWYEPAAKAHGYRPNADLIMDEYGRLLPSVNRFPSAANGAGFKPLADYVHSLGLKFGIHILRGIPRQAVRANLPILNSTLHAQDIANPQSTSEWIDDMYGVDMTKVGAQAYYDSIFALYASWDVDFVKADDMIWPYHGAEIEGMARAIEHSGHEIVLSLSPGVQIEPDRYDHLRQHCEMFRISADFWDRWADLKEQFALCHKWEAFTGAGCWADADMLPLGRIGIRAERGDDRKSLMTHDEQTTLMTLWTIARSPLMFGGDLPSNDAFTLGLLTNADVMTMHRASRDNRQLRRDGDQVVWTAQSSDSDDRYLALFNLSDHADAQIEVDLAPFGSSAAFQVRDLWDGIEMGSVQGKLSQAVVPHAAKLYRLRPTRD